MTRLRDIFTGFAVAALLILVSALPAPADQGSVCMPTSGTVSGLTFAQDVNAALQALITSNNGGTAPSNACGGAPQQGQLWLDTSVTPEVWRMYDDTGWEVIGYTDDATQIWTPPVGGGASSLASATTTDLWSVPQAYVTVSGTTTISKLASTDAVLGTVKFVAFSGVLQLTYNATQLILPTAASITTQAGDKALVVALGGSNAAVISYMRADGTPLETNSVFSSNIVFSGTLTPSALTTSTNNWAPSGLATSFTVRASATSNLSVTGIAAQTADTLLLLQNISASTSITLSDASASSTAANRFSFGADYVLGPQAAILLRYDGTLSRWVIASSGRITATQAQATAGTDNSTSMTPLRTAQAIAAFAPASSIITTYTTPGSFTWTKPATGSVADVTCIGAGASGGKGGSNQGSGGGGGAYYNRLMPLASLTSTVTVTIGAGGAAQTVNSIGADGGNSSFGTYVVGYGGSAGHETNTTTAGGPGAGPAGMGTGSTSVGVGGPDFNGIVTVNVGGSSDTGTSPSGSSYDGGGAGGFSLAGTSAANSGDGGSSVRGGAGGGGGRIPSHGAAGAGGTSIYAGDGGNGGQSGNAQAGASPGGGGGGSTSGNSGAGGNGECDVITW